MALKAEEVSKIVKDRCEEAIREAVEKTGLKESLVRRLLGNGIMNSVYRKLFIGGK